MPTQRRTYAEFRAEVEEIVEVHKHHTVTLTGCSMANDMGHIARAALTEPGA
ncbi:MAG TPA: hypothetical protein VNA25_06025 [Phycisphaerae bacterium]|nr:hypothetical protein [Phycisphaerae bacterium]